MSFSQEDIRFIRSRVEENLGRPVPENVTVKEGKGLTVTSGPEGAVIAAESRAALARGLTHLARAAAEGRKEVHIREKRHFEHCGPYLDLSRNGVMTVDAVKKYIDFSACLGLDMAVLYTEDTYEVPGYPYMGYLRGRLTGDEWRAIDEHGARMGVEVICASRLTSTSYRLVWLPTMGLSSPGRSMPVLLVRPIWAAYLYSSSNCGPFLYRRLATV